MRAPSHLRIAGYSTAATLDSVRASDLTEERFRRAYVNEMRPCRIVGAIDHWPASRLWTSPDYLLDRVGAIREAVAYTSPRGEFGLPSSIPPTRETLSFGEFVRRTTARECGHHVLYSYRLQAGPDTLAYDHRHPMKPVEFSHTLMQPLASDVTGFPFLYGARPPRGGYDPYRMFLFRNGYTDWHFHDTDETLMCQIGVAKEVLLAPPDEDTWNVVWPLIERHGGILEREIDLTGRLHRVVVEPGDALFIPPYWWHTAEPVEDRLGATVAACFASPLATSGDLRYPAARKLIRRLPFSAAPIVAAAVVASYVRRIERRVRTRARISS